VYLYQTEGEKMGRILMAMLVLVLVAACTPAGPEMKERKINSFESCAAAGNPVMESYPRQCNADGNVFVEEGATIQPEISLEEARLIAQTSECTAEGSLTDEASYNENSMTWWLGLDLEKQGCNPACVVDVKTLTAEINWRCTGLITE
jgi:hypothetical protein